MNVRPGQSNRLLAMSILLSAGLSGCIVSTSGDIAFIGGQEVMAQQRHRSNLQPSGLQSSLQPPGQSPREDANDGNANDINTDDIAFEVYRLARAEIYLLRVPTNAGYVIEPVATEGLAKLPSFALAPDVVAVINGGFFDPKNQQTASHVIREGEVLLDPNQNIDLITNVNVASYMDQILNRSEFRRYDCGGSQRYGISFHSGMVPAGCDRRDALGGGPQLLPKMTHQQEAFWDVVDGKVVRNPIGMTYPNARSAIGIAADGTVLLAMAAQLPPPPVQTPSIPVPSAPSSSAGAGQLIPTTLPPAHITPKAPPWRSGVTLEEMTDFLKEQGAVEALNLDGGSSSALHYNQRTYYGRLDKQGQTIQRSIKSALVVRRP